MTMASFLKPQTSCLFLLDYCCDCPTQMTHTRVFNTIHLFVELLGFMDWVFAIFSSNLDSLIMIAHYCNFQQYPQEELYCAAVVNCWPFAHLHIRSFPVPAKICKYKVTNPSIVNPSPVAQNKSCKEMSIKLRRTRSLEEASRVVTTARHKIEMAKILWRVINTLCL